MEKNMVIVLVGPSGSGKTALALEMEKMGAAHLPTCTTRPKESVEEDGRHHIFLTRQKFHAWERLGYFAEYAKFAGNHYGTLKRTLMSPDPVKVIVLEPFGAVQVKGWCDRHGIDCRIVWLDMPEPQRYGKMLERGWSEQKAQERLRHDDIPERWRASGLVADYRIDRHIEPSLLARDIFCHFGVEKRLVPEAVA